MEVYGNTTKENTNRLQTLQNKVIKALFCYHKHYPTTELYKELNILTIKQLFTYKLANLAWKMVNDKSSLLHTNLNKLYKTFDHKHQTRNKENFVITYKNTGHLNSLETNVKLIWNNLPNHTKEIKRLDTFKTEVLKYIREM